jgi:hypothetical protein
VFELDVSIARRSSIPVPLLDSDYRPCEVGDTCKDRLIVGEYPLGGFLNNRLLFESFSKLTRRGPKCL